MKRNVSLEEISDGKLYTLNDMVKADCHDCRGCSACCRGMGSSIILDPLDVCRLSVNLGKSFDELLEKELELGMVDGAILPNLRMTGPEEACVFWTAGGGAAFIRFVPASAASSLLADIIRRESSAIFFRCMSARSLIEQR